MKIGLVRHFKVVIDPGKRKLSPAEFAEAMQNYDSAPVSRNQLVLNPGDWDICYSSTLPRAVATAEKIFNGRIIKSDLLIEVPISPFTNRNIKLPSFVWHIGARIAWFRSHTSQVEDIKATKMRIEKLYDMIKASGCERILLVSHGYFLKMFTSEMKKKGFKGEEELNIKNGKLYLIEN
jgi:broad specificity phosphatase PhoE